VTTPSGSDRYVCGFFRLGLSFSATVPRPMRSQNISKPRTLLLPTIRRYEVYKKCSASKTWR